MGNQSESLGMYQDPSPNASNFPLVKTTLPHLTDRSKDLTRFTHTREKLALAILPWIIYSVVWHTVYGLKRHVWLIQN